MLKKSARNKKQKIEYKKFKKDMEAQFVKKYFPKGDRINRKIYLKKIESNPSFQKELKKMRNLFLK